MSRLSDKLSKGEVYFIAEMSANHGNDLETALEQSVVRCVGEA